MAAATPQQQPLTADGRAAAVPTAGMHTLDTPNTAAGPPQGGSPAHLHRLYVVGIPDHFTDPQLRAVFEKVRPAGQGGALRPRGPD